MNHPTTINTITQLQNSSYFTGLSSPPPSPCKSCSTSPHSYVYLLRRAYIALLQQNQDTCLIDDIRFFLSEHIDPVAASQDLTTVPRFDNFDMDSAPSPPSPGGVSKLKYPISNTFDEADPFLSPVEIPSNVVDFRSSRESHSWYGTENRTLSNSQCDALSQTSTTNTVDNLWRSIKKQLQDLQAENQNVLSLVTNSDVTLKNAAATVVTGCNSIDSVSDVTSVDRSSNHDEIFRLSYADVAYGAQNENSSCYDETLPPSPTEIALRALLYACKHEETRNVLDETLSFLDRGYDDKVFRYDIRQIIETSSTNVNQDVDSKSVISKVIRWIRFLFVLFLSLLICLLDGPKSFNE